MKKINVDKKLYGDKIKELISDNKLNEINIIIKDAEIYCLYLN